MASICPSSETIIVDGWSDRRMDRWMDGSMKIEQKDHGRGLVCEDFWFVTSGFS